jgi:ribose-phosphate pyrophosphokinase
MSINVKINDGKPLDISFLTFSGGERHIQLPETNSLIANQVEILARIRDTTSIMDLLLVVNALRYQFGDNVNINLTLPYLPYARQDRVCATGQAFSLEVFSGLLTSLRLNKITVWDCHSQEGLDLTGAINVSPENIIKASESLVSILTAPDSVLVCPDQGAQARCTAIKNTLAVQEMVQCFKKRDPATGKILNTEVEVDSLEGKTAIITDDICDGGFTFIKIAEQLKEKGAKKVILFVTHGIFSKGLTVFQGLIDEIYTTNSFELANNISEKSVPLVNIINY